MRQLLLPFYAPSLAAPERAVLSLLGAALRVTEQALHDEHPGLDHPMRIAEHHAPLVVATARLVVDRCAELRALLDFYDAAIDDVIQPDDDAIPF